MKYILLVVCITLLLLGTVTAAEFDNRVKDYNATTKEYLVKNFFNLGQDIYRIKEVYNTQQCSEDCYTDFKIDVYDDILLSDDDANNDLFSVFKWEFIDLKTGEKLPPLQHGYKLATTNTTIEVPGVVSCEKVSLKNGTEGEECTQEYDNVSVPDYQDFDYKSAKLAAGSTIYLRIWGKKQWNQNVDHIPTIAGAKLDAFSQWTTVAALGNYTFDNSGNLGANTGKNLYTLSNMTTSNLYLNQSSCIDGNCARTQGQATLTSNQSYSSATQVMWVRPIVNSSTGTVCLSTYDGGSNVVGDYAWGWGGCDGAGSGGTMTLYFNTGTTTLTITANGSVYNPGVWYLLAAATNGSTGFLYVNGELVGQGSAGGTSAFFRTGTNTNNFFSDGVPANPLNATIDLVRFFDVPLSKAQLQDMYNTENPNGFTDSAPTINLSIPANASSFAAPATVTFNVSANDTQNVTNMSLYMDGILNKTQTFGQVNTSWQFTIDFNAAGTHQWSIVAYNNRTLNSSSSWRTFTVTDAFPTVTLVTPANNSVQTSPNVTFNITSTDNLGLANITLYINGVANLTQSMSGTTGNFYSGIQMADGWYNYTAVATDNANQQNTTANFTFQVNTSVSINFVQPLLANGTATNKTSIWINVTASANNYQAMEIRLYNGTDYISPKLKNTTVTTANSYYINYTGLPDGVYYINATANTSIGLSASTNTLQYLIDTTTPWIDFISPTLANASFSTTSKIVMTSNFTNNTFEPVLTLYAYIVNQSNLALINSTSITGALPTPYNINLSVPYDGTFLYYEILVDRAGNANMSAVRTVFVDTSAPFINITSPTPANGSTVTTLPINITATDTFLLNITIYLYNSSQALVGSSASLQSPAYINFTGLAAGTYFYNATARDQAGNTNSTITRTAIVTDAAPTITLVSPSNASVLTQRNISFNVTATDNLQVKNITIYINGAINNTQTFSSTTANFYDTIYLLDGIYNWTAVVTDSANQKTWGPNISFQITSFFINASIYNASSLETRTEVFEVNLSTLSTILSVTARLWYNGTRYTASSSCSSNTCRINRTIDIPVVDNTAGDSENKTFFWEVTVYDGSSAVATNTSVFGQNVSKIQMSQCGNIGGGYANYTSLNYTAYDEQNRSRIGNFDFQAEYNYYLGMGTTYKQLNISNSSAKELDICIDKNLTYFTDAIVAYQPVNTSQTAYTTRNLFYQRYAINTTVQNLSLLMLRSAASTSFLLQVQDRSAQAVPNVLVESQKCYPGDNTNKTAFISRTDTSGQTVGNFEAETALYKFFITNQSNVLLAVSSCDKVVPQTAPYTLLFQLGETYTSPFTLSNATNITSSLIYNNSGQQVVFTYIDVSDEFNLGSLIVQNMNFTGTSQPTYCSSNSTIPSSIITCNVTTAGTYTGYAYVYRNNETLYQYITFTVETFSSTVGKYGIFLAFFIILVSAFAFKFNEIAGIWCINVAVIFVNYIGLVAFGNVFITAMLCISIIITAVLER